MRGRGYRRSARLRSGALAVRIAAAAFLIGAHGFAAEAIPDLVQDFSGALQSGDAVAAVSFFDSKAKEYPEIRGAIEEIAALPHTESEMEAGPAKVQGGTASLEVKWTLRLSPRDGGPLLIRTENVTIGLRRTGEDWKIVSLHPLAILSRPTTGVFDAIAGLATSLSAGDVPDAIAAFDSRADGYGRLSNDIDALITQTDVLCAIDIVADRETGGVHKVDTDWYLEIKPKADGAGAQRRRQRVLIQLEKRHGGFRITALDPASIVSPVL
ncbi:MAG: hypothetical protein KGN84_03125 [Acidobacteriota bacterium]|nr:hypothetical protein [Acidobacteriota bacterium]